MFICARFNERKQSDTIYQHEERTRLTLAANEQNERVVCLQDIFQWKVICQHIDLSRTKSLHKKYFPMEKRLCKENSQISESLFSCCRFRCFVFSINTVIYLVHFYNHYKYSDNYIFLYSLQFYTLI